MSEITRGTLYVIWKWGSKKQGGAGKISLIAWVTGYMMVFNELKWVKQEEEQIYRFSGWEH